MTASVSGDNVSFHFSGTHSSFDGVRVIQEKPTGNLDYTANFNSSTIYSKAAFPDVTRITIKPTSGGYGVGQSGDIVITFSAVPDVFTHTFNISDPEGGMYYVVQNGQILANRQVPPGGGAFTVTSPSNANYQLFKITGGEYVTGTTSGADGAGIWLTPETVVKSGGLAFPTATPSSSGVTMTPGAGSTAGSGAAPLPTGNGAGAGKVTPATTTAPVVGPTAPTPTTPAPSTPTPSTAPTAPGSTPSAAPDATAGAAANTIKAAVDTSTAQAVDNAAKTIAAVDKTTAKVAETGAATVDTLNKILNSGHNNSVTATEIGNKQLGALDKINAKLDVANAARATSDSLRASQAADTNNLLGANNGLLTSINATLAANAQSQTSRDGVRDAKLDAIKSAIADSTSEKHLKAGEGTSAASVLSSAQGQATTGAAVGVAAKDWRAPAGSSVAATGGGSFSPTAGQATVRVAGTDVKFSLDVGSYYPAADSALKAGRALILFALGVWFVRSCSSSVETYVAALGNARSGGGPVGPENIVPGVGVAKSWVGTTAIVVAIAAACAATVALIDTLGGVAGVTVTSLFGAVNLSALGTFYGFLDQFYPVAASASLAVMRAGFGYLVAPIYLAASAAARFLSI